MTTAMGGGGWRGRRARRALACLLPASLLPALLALTGCGGTDDPVKVSLALDPGQVISTTAVETQVMPAQTVMGRAIGDLASLNGATIYAAIEDPSSLFAAATATAQPDGTFALTLQGRPLATSGHFTGALRIHVSLEPGGLRPFGGSPLHLPYDVTVLDPIPLDATSLRVERQFGDPPATVALRVAVAPYVTNWSASVGATQDCRGMRRASDPAAPIEEIGCAADGTISLSVRPAAPGTSAETVTVRAEGQYLGRRFAVRRQVGVTRVVAPNAAIDYAAYPPQLPVIERTAGDPWLGAVSFALIPNSGVSVAWAGVEYLSSPAAASGHPWATGWWQPSPSPGTLTCDVAGASPHCLPEGRYTARLHWVLTRDGVVSDLYYPITLEIVAQDYLPVALGSYIDYGFQGSTNRIQVVASSATSVTRRTSWGSMPSNSYLDDFVLGAVGEYLQTARSCSTATSTCSVVATYAEPEVIFPASTVPGFSETTVSSVTGLVTDTVTRTVTVDGIESVTVPAGTFAALKLTARSEGATYDGYNVTWWARGIGRVKILNYPASNPASTQTWLMTAHGVAPVP